MIDLVADNEEEIAAMQKSIIKDLMYHLSCKHCLACNFKPICCIVQQKYIIENPTSRTSALQRGTNVDKAMIKMESQ
jgi:hypothetical protein